MKTNPLKLIPYLPYDLRIKEGNTIYTMTGSFLDDWINYPRLQNEFKPLLIPLTEENITEEDLGKTFCPNRLRLINLTEVNGLYHFQFEYMVSRHFDVFGLFDKGLALNKKDYI